MRGENQHLSIEEIEQLTGLAADVADGAMEGAMGHLDACAHCKLRMLLSQIGEVPKTGDAPQQSQDISSPCPEEGRWLELAAGIMPQEERLRWLEHAALCDKCGPLLQAAIEDVGMDLTKQEEAKVASLNSAQSGWQEGLAARITGQPAPKAETEPKPGRTAKAFAFWPRWAFSSAAALLVAVVGWWSWIQFRTPPVEALLAQAYTERRTIEVRIAGAKYAPMRVERGTGGSSLDKPQALLKAEELIAENLKRHPDDPAWLQAKARADLLDGNSDAAIQSLQRASEISPDSTFPLTDLASSYFQRAEATENQEDDAKAIELLGRVLAKDPNDLVALFNQAVVCEHFFLYTQAVDDWEHYLRVDPRGSWADEARRRLGALREKLRMHDQIMMEPLLTPADLVGLGPEGVKQSRFDDRIEEYVQLALTDWLPKAYPANSRNGAAVTVHRAALSLLAQVAREKHGDLWLTDLLSATATKTFPDAITELSGAVEGNDIGDNVLAHDHAAKAEQLFRAAANWAGTLRAQVEYLFASHDAQQGSPCLQAAHRLIKHPADLQYQWLQTQYDIERGTCYGLLGNLGEAQRLYTQAASEAKASGYGQIYLRTQDHLSDLGGISGDLRASWNRTQQGLASFWSGGYPPMRGYNFYYNLYEFSRLTKQPHLQMAAWRDALILSDHFNDNVLRAMAHSAMADAATSAEQPEIAERELTQTTKLFAASPQIKSVRIARLEAETRLAEVEASGGRPMQALARLSGLESEVAQLPDSSIPLLFFTTLGIAEASAGDNEKSEVALSSAIAFSEHQMRSLHDEKSRIQWSRQFSSAYRSLVQQKLQGGDNYGSLELWEWYRGVAQRLEGIAKNSPPDIGVTSSTRVEVVRSEQMEVARWLPSISGETVISYAILPDGLAIWVYDNRGVFAHWIEGSSSDVEARAAHFHDLCSDPRSEKTDLQITARGLYDLLIAPVEQYLPPDRSLLIEADEELAEIPFGALLDRQNRFLSDRTPVIASLGLYYWKDLRASLPIRQDASALIIAVSASTVPLRFSTATLPDALAEGDMVAHYFESARILANKEATITAIGSLLPSIQVFHFAGHAITSAERTGLLLSDTLLNSASLEGGRLAKMQLAVLSACDTQDGSTGIYDPEGLVRAFLRSGVPHVVASRWNVDSAATKQFMQLFYQALLAGNQVGKSIQSAQTALRSKPGTDHPYYWAAFTAFGAV